jgi:hypothetical protein
LSLPIPRGHHNRPACRSPKTFAAALPAASTSAIATGTIKTVKDIVADAIKSSIATASKDDLERLKAALGSSSGIPTEYDGLSLGISRTMLGKGVNRN